jgi:hypothetical protein
MRHLLLLPALALGASFASASAAPVEIHGARMQDARDQETRAVTLDITGMT